MKAGHNGHLIALVIQSIIKDAIDRWNEKGSRPAKPCDLSLL
jgi:hypothetical protein